MFGIQGIGYLYSIALSNPHWLSHSKKQAAGNQGCCHLQWALNAMNGIVESSKYKHVLFLNSSVRGPFLPAYFPVSSAKLPPVGKPVHDSHIPPMTILPAGWMLTRPRHGSLREATHTLRAYTSMPHASYGSVIAVSWWHWQQGPRNHYVISPASLITPKGVLLID